MSAYWASWADTRPNDLVRHGVVADLFVRELEGDGLHASFMMSAPQLVNQTSLSQVGFGKDGNTKPP